MAIREAMPAGRSLRWIKSIPLLFAERAKREGIARTIGRSWNGTLAYLSFLRHARWEVQPIRPDTTYVFTFLGEFGFELMNWQGVVRKFAGLLPDTSDIVCAGRKGLDLFYENASQYHDISDFALFKESVAAAYFVLPPDDIQYQDRLSPRQVEFNRQLREALRAHLTERIARPGRRLEFVFGSTMTLYPGCAFGAEWDVYGRPWAPGRIYATLDVHNNMYRRIEPDLQTRPEIEKALGFALDRPYALVQTRRRRIGPQFGQAVPERPLIDELSRHMPVVVLSFDTGRFLDSFSAPETGQAGMIYRVRSFRDQSCLIAHAKKCVFVTEGDLASHNYLPPFMGKDVVSVASRDVFDRESAPVAFWNKHVFRFGGQIIPWVAESVFESAGSLRRAVDGIMKS